MYGIKKCIILHYYGVLIAQALGAPVVFVKSLFLLQYGQYYLLDVIFANSVDELHFMKI